MSCRNDSCANCDGNYPEIASAFTRVPNNFNSVNNSIDKFSLYKTLSVVEKAVEHVKCSDRKCAETGSKDSYHTGADDVSMGFLQYPLRIRTDFVQVCGDLHCAKDGPLVDCDCCNDDDDLDCNNSALGFVAWPKHDVAQDVRACNGINDHIACFKRYRGRETSKSCNILMDCDASSSSFFSAVAAEKQGSKSAHKRHARRRRGCGCH